MWNVIYISLECLVDIAFGLLLLPILFSFKRSRPHVLVIYGLYLALTEFTSLLSSLYESDPQFFMNQPLYILADILFYYGFPVFFFYRYTQGPALRNCGLILVFSTAALPFMLILHLIRKYFMLGPSILAARSPGDFAALLVSVLAYGIALLLAGFIRSRLWDKVKRIPSAVFGGIYVIDSLIALVSGLSHTFSAYVADSTGDMASTLNLGIFFCIGLGLWLLAAIAAFLIHDRINYRKKRRLLQAEMDLQHAYYQSIVSLQFRVRSLRHDLINHLNVLEHLDLIKSPHRDTYCQAFLSHCDKIEDEVSEVFRWKEIRTDSLTDRECYIIYYYLKAVLAQFGCAWEDCRISRTRSQSGSRLIVRLPQQHPTPLWWIAYRQDPYFQLLSAVLQRRDGSVCWRKGESQWEFILTLSS
ncbi:hypothetical protein NE619_08470 [Anaerovorax odorimutans]|uniref:GHKL domain-containing protein n=1 Tax=Anaerovorax odorimutans TaxID=109327 RepID=A0ABT1RNI2_9FIRM|nr:hypothetical protein [Anaerovorax odorimutans]MCQ4636763.1 hypothetical protein [Anaerovorax odorimutans]